MDKLKDQSRASMEAAMQEAEQPSSLPVFPHESHSILGHFPSLKTQVWPRKQKAWSSLTA
jgi:hypothetical protein